MLCNEEGCCSIRGRTGRGISDLGTFSLKSFQNCAKGRLGKATVEPGLLIGLISRTQSLGAIIKGITERFVYAIKGVTSSHENLQSDELQDRRWTECSFTLSKAVEHERGWVATKMGLSDMLEVDNDSGLMTPRSTDGNRNSCRYFYA